MCNMENDNGLLPQDTSQAPSLRELIARKIAQNEKSFVELRADNLKEIKSKCELPEKGVLYYPACGQDNSPSLALPNWRVMYMDAVDTSILGINPNDILVKGDLMKPPFNPDDIQFDVAMLVSPGSHLVSFSPQYIEKVVEYLKPNGLLICDDYHSTASDAREKLGSTLKEVDMDQSGLRVFQKMVDDIGIEPMTFAM